MRLRLLRVLLTGILVAVVAPATAQPLPDSVDRNGDGEIVIACLGDSNTASTWQGVKPGGFEPELGWCEQLLARLEDPRVRILNMGVGGATVSPNIVSDVPADRVFFSGVGQLESVLSTDPVDVVILAFGTNDVLADQNGVPEEIVDNYNRLWRIVRSRGLLGFVIVTPTVFPHPRTGEIRRSLAAIAETNARIDDIFAPRFVLDFELEMGPQHFMDDLHMNAAGQALRASEAHRGVAALGGVTGPRAGVRAVRWSEGHWGLPNPEPEPEPKPAADAARGD
ncbi:MAG: SGNH/GDSL hydrolase family protein [Candidatus Binatia bacterium]|nr:SGNH/GDSL hydrolase family protein [Candidatus Binatia bacterium]